MRNKKPSVNALKRRKLQRRKRERQLKKKRQDWQKKRPRLKLLPPLKQRLRD